MKEVSLPLSRFLSCARMIHGLKKFALQFVLQPADPEMASRPCPVCKEHFKGEYSDDEEDWVWKNAVNVDGVVCPFFHCISFPFSA
jgi:hypothetical protein